jgi:hypothetical protein
MASALRREPLSHELDEEIVARTWVKSALRSEMVKRSISYAELAKRLSLKFEAREDEHVLRNKVARGRFSAAFLVQCLAVMGCKSLPIDLFEHRQEILKAIARDLDAT